MVARGRPTQGRRRRKRGEWRRSSYRARRTVPPVLRRTAHEIGRRQGGALFANGEAEDGGGAVWFYKRGMWSRGRTEQAIKEAVADSDQVLTERHGWQKVACGSLGGVDRRIEQRAEGLAWWPVKVKCEWRCVCVSPALDQEWKAWRRCWRKKRRMVERALPCGLGKKEVGGREARERASASRLERSA